MIDTRCRHAPHLTTAAVGAEVAIAHVVGEHDDDVGLVGRCDGGRHQGNHKAGQHEDREWFYFHGVSPFNACLHAYAPTTRGSSAKYRGRACDVRPRKCLFDVFRKVLDLVDGWELVLIVECFSVLLGQHHVVGHPALVVEGLERTVVADVGEETPVRQGRDPVLLGHVLWPSQDRK